MKPFRLFAVMLLVSASSAALAGAQVAQYPWSVRMANEAMGRWPDAHFQPAASPWAWTHDQATLLAGMQALWLRTADVRYYDYLKHSVDALVGADGSLPDLNTGTHQLTDIQLGRQLLLLYGVTLDKRYFNAATLLYTQLQRQPRNASGGFWTAQAHPDQMTPDSIDEAEPFYAEYAREFHHPEAFADITRQFALIQEHVRDPRTGLIHQGWDESKQERWANQQTGRSAQAWGRGMGWYMAALVDTLPSYPEGDSGRALLIAILNQDAAAVTRYQDAKTGLWFQVLDKTGAKGNFPEASASSLIVYALAKGVRRGYLPERYLAVAERGYQGVVHRFVTTGVDGSVSLRGTVEATDLGGAPYHDGSYAFYTGERTIVNDPMGVGVFILADTELEDARNATLGRGVTVMLDAWFNSQKRTDATGREVYFHYKWDDQSNSGYSLFGHMFRNFGARTTTLYAEPTLANLHSAQVYIIASPDNFAKNPHAHFANARDASQIAVWVKAGGVLAILENDTSFADLDHFNLVSEKFGIHFNSVLRMHAVGRDWAMGRFQIDRTGPIFHHPHTAYVKDVCTISVASPAVPVYTHDGDIFMAAAHYGKGIVYAMVDPWVYNEYTDGRNLPSTYDNYGAGVELARWLLEQVPHPLAAEPMEQVR